MNILIEKELSIYLEKIVNNNPKEKWIEKNLPNLYSFMIEKEGNKFSEKVFIYKNGKNFCKSCSNETKFLSYKRGYREFCSKKCSNNDKKLLEQKTKTFKLNSLKKWGVDNPSKSDKVKEKIKDSKKDLDYNKINKKIKETCLKNLGVDNPSKSDKVKKKKKESFIKSLGVENPFQSEKIKEKIKETNIKKWGYDHPLKSEKIKEKVKETNNKKWGVDNFTKSTLFKEMMFEKYRSSSIKTNLNSDKNYSQYIGLGTHELKCDSGLDHVYQTNSHLYHARIKLNNKQCTICYPVGESSSFKELELLEYIKSVYKGKVIKSYRDGLELDIYLPELNLGFEFNGLYWHSELFKDKSYHLDKTKYFNKKNIRVIHIWEDDWDFRKDIVKSQIKNWLGLIENKIFARKCYIKEIDSVKEYKDFLNKNHIQGYTSASIKIGLFHEEELVSLMTFDKFEGRKKMLENEWNLSRFCNKLNYSVIGGASKLLKYFIKNYSVKRLISFSDNSWSEGNLYKKLGFDLKSQSYPNYSYLIDKKRSNKQKWKKSNLIKMGFDKNLSESKIMEDKFGAYKIFDCGQNKFELNL